MNSRLWKRAACRFAGLGAVRLGAVERSGPTVAARLSHPHILIPFRLIIRVMDSFRIPAILDKETPRTLGAGCCFTGSEKIGFLNFKILKKIKKNLKKIKKLKLIKLLKL